MTIIQMKQDVSLPVLLNSVEQLSTPELENFVAAVLSIQAKRRAPSLPKEEATLLQKINQGLPVATQQRFDYLNEKRRDETLTKEEHQELLTLIEQIEENDVECVKYLGQLAQWRNVSLSVLMKQLGDTKGKQYEYHRATHAGQFRLGDEKHLARESQL